MNYLLPHSTNLKFIKNLQVLPVNEYSDHAPLLFSFECGISGEPINQNSAATETKIFWDATKEPAFIEKMAQYSDRFLLVDNHDLSIDEKIETLSKIIADISF